MVPFAFNSNLLIGSAPRTLPIRFSMTKMVLFFVVASLLASDPIISAPGAECMAMEAADGDNHAGRRFGSCAFGLAAKRPQLMPSKRERTTM